MIVALGLIVLSSASEANGVRLHNDAYYFMKRQFAYLVVLSSASEANAVKLYGQPHYFMARQFVFLGAGLVIVVVTAFFDYHKWREHWMLAVLFYVGVFCLLWAVFLFPEDGPRRISPAKTPQRTVTTKLRLLSIQV